MQFYPILVVILLSMLFSFCGNRLITVETQDEGVLYERYTIDKDSVKQGIYYQYYPSGKVFMEAMYSNDTIDGTRKFFYENGQLKSVENLEKGNWKGSYLSYYDNGQLESEGQYIDGAMSGVWKRYFKTGELLGTLTFANNEENGPFTFYHQNGNLKEEGTYRNGDNLYGEFKIYDETGELVMIKDCDGTGWCDTRWKKQGYPPGVAQ